MKTETIPYKIYLAESEMPRYWYNIRADMVQKPAPLLHPGTHAPMTAQELEEMVIPSADEVNEVQYEDGDDVKEYKIDE